MSQAPTDDDAEMAYDAVVFPNEDVARKIAPLINPEMTIYSQDDAWESKFHLHDNETGEVLTQVNIGASVNWETLVDLRDPSQFENPEQGESR